MFTQKCFIRKSTGELTDKIYKFGGRSGRGFWHSKALTLLVSYPDHFTCYDDENGIAERLIKDGFIDCGTNEGLFLALSALRDDKDKDQWFTDGIHWEKYPLGGFMSNEMKIKWESRYAELGKKHTPHKATVQELIEHFKNK